MKFRPGVLTICCVMFVSFMGTSVLGAESNSASNISSPDVMALSCVTLWLASS